MQLTFCGVRGSSPSPGAAFLRYGGHTSCVAVGEDDRPPSLVLDAGTGLREVSALLAGRPFQGSLLLGHLHWDHVQGMPFFAAGAAPGSRVDVFLPEQGGDAEQLLARGFSPPHFPITPSQLGAGWSFANLPEGRRLLDGFDVLARQIPHKGGRTFGFRVSHGGASMAYLSDHSPTSLGPGPDGLGERHEAALTLADGVDVLVHDAQHRAVEFPEVDYLGHASAAYAVALAREAGARTVVLYHHDPRRTDEQVEALLAEVATGDVQVVAACQGLVIRCAEEPATR